ncbi:MAG: glucose-6-phosphate isomerase, partial [Erysipelotrichaceae bacterium]
MIKLSTDKAFLKEDIYDYQERVTKAHEDLMNKKGAGSELTGWVELPDNYDKNEINRINEVAKRITEDCDVFLACGIGGSYLGARAAIEMINGLYPNKKPEIIYIGNGFSSTYLLQVYNYIQDKSVVMNVISKSGSTTETQIALRLFRDHINDKYGKEEAKRRIVVTTDAKKGFIKEMAIKDGYETFNFPEDIGGRYSVLTAVGLLPIAVAGININDMLDGAQLAKKDLATSDLHKNQAYQYAVARRILENQGNHVEMLVTYEMQMSKVAEWWKQLFAESEGKENKGILPVSANFSADLHSIGQFIQEGTNLVFETSLVVKNPTLDKVFPGQEHELEEMNYLCGRSLHYINRIAAKGTLEAHADEGGVSNLVIELEDMSAKTFGYMVYFFSRACAISVYLLDLNPFDQPGVEVYKKRM